MGKLTLKKLVKQIIMGVLVIAIMAAPVNVSAAIPLGGYSKYVSIETAAEGARKEILNHKSLVKVYIKSTNSDPEAVFYEFQDEVMKETDNGDEGDYMYWDLESRSPYYIRYSSKIGNTTYYFYQYEIGLTYYTTLEQKYQVDEKVDEIIQSFGFTDKTTDYGKIVTIYDYICNNVRYAQDATQKIVYTSWAALFTQEAVCQGYSQLMYRLLKEVGISCRVIPGYGTNYDGKHGWNIVKLGDYYYNVDATWDAQLKQSGQPYEYFLKGDDFKEHTRLDSHNTAEFYAKYPMSATDYSVAVTPVASEKSQESAFSTIKPKFKSVTRKKVKLIKVADAYKYQIKYSTSKKFNKNTKTVNTKKTTYKLKKLKKKKAYYIKFRAYKYVDKSKMYTKWSAVKKIKKK